MSSYVPLRIAAVLGAIVGFSALSVCSWIYTVPWSPTVARDTHSLFSCLISPVNPEPVSPKPEAATGENPIAEGDTTARGLFDSGRLIGVVNLKIRKAYSPKGPT